MYSQATLVATGKQVYSPENVNYIMNTEMPVWDKLKLKQGVAPNGLGYYFPVSFAVNQSGRSYGSSTGPFMQIGVPNRNMASITPKRTYWDVSIDKTIAEFYGDKNSSFEGDPVANALEESFTGMKLEIHRQFCAGTGSGTITSVSSGAASATQTVADAIYFQVNMQVDIYDSGGTTLKGTRTVNSFDHIAGTVTLNSSITTATGDIFVRRGITPSGGEEMTGLPVIIGNASDAATFEGISRTSNNLWNSQVLNAASASITIDTVDRMVDRVEMIRGTGIVDLLVSRQGQIRKVKELVIPMIQYASGAAIDAGADKPKVSKLEMFADRYIPLGTMFGISTKNLGRYETFAMGIANDPEGYTWLRKSGYDEAEAYIRYIAQFGSEDPAAHFKLTNLLEPSY